MALGSNNQDQTKVPEEIQDYYQTERRERAGVAWLLAFGTLIITVVVATGIFFAGRWAYRQVAGTDEPETTEIAQEDTQKEESPASSPSEGGNSGAAKDTEKTPAPETEAPAAGDSETKAAADQEDTTPITGDTEEDSDVAGATTIPDTGPGNVAAVFATVSALGYLAHRLYTRRYAED